MQIWHHLSGKAKTIATMEHCLDDAKIMCMDAVMQWDINCNLPVSAKVRVSISIYVKEVL